MPWMSNLVVVAAISVTCLITWICLREANTLLRILGKNGMGALTRIMGFLLICIAAQMMIMGSHGVLVTWEIIQDLSKIPTQGFPF